MKVGHSLATQHIQKDECSKEQTIIQQLYSDGQVRRKMALENKLQPITSQREMD